MIDLPTFNELYNTVLEQLKTNQILAAGSILGFLAGVATAVWLSIKKAAAWLWNRVERKIVYRTTVYETNVLYDDIQKWLFDHYEKSYRNTEAKVFNGKLKFQQFEDLVFLRRGLNILRLWKGREKLENANSLQNAYLNHFNISGIFAKRAINRLLEDVNKYSKHLKELNKKYEPQVYVNSGYGDWNFVSNISPKPLKNMIIDGKDDLVADIEKFIGNRQWYEDRALMYKRGCLMKGKPGNGKSSLIMSLAMHFKKDLFIMNPSRVTDDDFVQLYRNVHENSFLLFEDIDAMFDKKRKKKDKESRLNFSTLLNCIDGALSKEGIIVFFTTNHPERLDPALIRAGRMDYVMDVDCPSPANIKKYLDIFYESDLDIGIGKTVKNDSLPMVKVQDICIRNKDNPTKAIKEIKGSINNL